MKKLIYVLIFLVCGLSNVEAQNYNFYLQNAYKNLEERNVENAKKLYSIYQKLSNKSDPDFEAKLAKLSSKNDFFQQQLNENTKIIDVNGIQIHMKHINGGHFKGRVPDLGDCQRATAKEWNLFNLHVSDYYIATTEVTQGLWETVMKETFTDYLNRIKKESDYLRNENLAAAGIGEQYPVYCIPHKDALEFIMRLNQITGQNFRLPTTREWIYTEGGGNKSLGFKYSGSNNIDRVAWYRDNSNNKVHPVATKLPNELGLYDFSGNVMEWTQCPYLGYTIYGSWYECSEEGCLLQNNWRAKGAFPGVGFRLAMDYK